MILQKVIIVVIIIVIIIYKINTAATEVAEITLFTKICKDYLTLFYKTTR